MVTMIITAQELRALAARVFSLRGMATAHAEQLADVLVWADLSGHSSHGVIRIERYLRFIERGDLDLSAIPNPIQTFGALQTWDGCRAAGAVALLAALPAALETAREHGISLTSITNTTHVGAAGYYAERIANAGMVGIVMAAGVPIMTYHGTAAAALSTAPIAIGLPRAGSAPVLLDMATSVAALGKIRQAAVAQDPIPDNWALDANGEPTTDAANAKVMRPVGGPKGSGLALMVELIASVLPGAPILSTALMTDAPKQHRQNATIIAIDIEKLRPLNDFAADVESLITTLKAQPTQTGTDEILLPGERSAATRVARSQAGIPLDVKLIDRLKALIS